MSSQLSPSPVAYLGSMALDATQATRLINASGWDEGNRSMRAAGRTTWSEEDYRAACAHTDRLFEALDLRPRRRAPKMIRCRS